jgi:hypothetical protein
MNTNQQYITAADAAGKIRQSYLCDRAPRAGPAYPVGYAPAPRADRFDFSRPASFQQIDQGPQTVEQLLDQGYFATSARAPETAVLHDRRETSWLGLDDVLTQVRQRHAIYHQNMDDLLWGECYAFDELARHGWPPSLDQQSLYEQRMQRLASDERAERVGLWQDVSRLRQALPEIAQLYLSAARKLQILDEDGGDAL